MVVVAGGVWCQGGVLAVMGFGGVWWRCFRCLGASPRLARRWLSAWRALNASWMRMLRAMMVVAVNSAMAVRPVVRWLPRVSVLVAWSLIWANVRSAAVRRGLRLASR